MKNRLTHMDDNGRPTMVDVSDKALTAREAVAQGRIRMSQTAFDLAFGGHNKKGDVRAVAQIAGIMAGKKTSDLIPLCHPLPLSSLKVEIEPDPSNSSIVVTARAKTTGQTGVEMEALTAVSIACLTIYDMLKAVDKTMVIEAIHMLEKIGGKSGHYRAVAETT